jgi:solute carrier family 35 protein F1/2
MVLIPTAAMFILYTVAPMLYRLASSAYFNLSLLSSDFYGLLFGKRLIVDLLRDCA